LLFLHGLGCSKEAFLPVTSHPLFKNFSTITIDLIGFGSSDKPRDFTYTLEAQAAAISSAIQFLEFDSLHVVAHSFGASLALFLAPQLLQHVKSLSFLEGNLVAEDCDMFSRRLANVDFAEFEKTVFPQFCDEQPKGLGYFNFESTSPFAFYKSAQSLVKHSDSGVLLELFRTLPCQKVYFYGEQNKDMPILSQLTDIPKIQIPNSGHFMMSDNQEAFCKELFDFVSSTESKVQSRTSS